MHLKKGIQQEKHHCDTKNEPFDLAFTLYDYAHFKPNVQ
jgi:hypothetical protein